MDINNFAAYPSGGAAAFFGHAGVAIALGFASIYTLLLI